MSTSSMMTASVEIDATLGNAIDVGNQICVLVTTQCYDTPLCPSSFREEDVIKLCIEVGQDNLEGVLTAI